ncbi:MAG: trigger factor [Anaerolineae bacterium]
MKVATEVLEGREALLEIQLDQEELDQAMQEAARRISREVQIPGFRKGKAPYAVVVRMVGREALREEALDALLPRLYKEALKEAQITPYKQGVLEEVSESDPPVLRIRVPLEPLVELGDYRAIQVPWEEPDVPEEEIQKALEDIARKYTSWEAKEGPVEEGDMVLISLEGRAEDGRLVLEDKGMRLVVRTESVYPLPGFHQELLGLRAGETREFTLPFPEGSSDRMATGESTHFKVKVLEVMRRDAPPLDDDLAKLAGDYETLDDLRKAIREQLLQKYLAEAEVEYGRRVLEALREISRVEFPAVALEEELEAMLEAQERNLEERGLNLETYLSILKTTPEAYREGLKPAAEKRLVTRLLLQKVAEAEGLEPTKEDMELALRALLDEETDKRKKEIMLKSESVWAAVREALRADKAEEWLVRYARGGSPEEPAADRPGSEEVLSEQSVGRTE